MIYRLIRLCRILAVLVIGAAFTLKGLASVLSQVLAAWRSGRQTDLRAGLTKPESNAGRNDARKTRRAVFVTLLGFGLLAGIGGLLVVVSGLVPIAASSGHWPITEWFLKFAMSRSVSTHSLGIHTPPLNDPDLVVKGGAYYEIGCRPCHGSPGLAQPRIASRMVPHPPDLVRRAGELEPRELFYIVKHGVKFTGMPAWPSQQRDDEVWAVVAFLKTLAHLDKDAYQQLVRGHSPSTSQMLSLDERMSIAPIISLNCARCHGFDGVGRGTLPKLAGQRQGYLENALKAYASGTRHSGMMEPMSVGLSPEDIRDAAGYYAAQSSRGTLTPVTDPGALERGRAIAENGIPEQRVPSCLDCHAPEGEKFNANFPDLYGQHAKYLVLQLELLQKGKRGGSAYAHLMEPIAKRLKPDQIRDVAIYLESLQGP